MDEEGILKPSCLENNESLGFSGLVRERLTNVA